MLKPSHPATFPFQETSIGGCNVQTPWIQGSSYVDSLSDGRIATPNGSHSSHNIISASSQPLQPTVTDSSASADGMSFSCWLICSDESEQYLSHGASQHESGSLNGVSTDLWAVQQGFPLLSDLDCSSASCTTNPATSDSDDFDALEDFVSTPALSRPWWPPSLPEETDLQLLRACTRPHQVCLAEADDHVEVGGEESGPLSTASDSMSATQTNASPALPNAAVSTAASGVHTAHGVSQQFSVQVG